MSSKKKRQQPRFNSTLMTRLIHRQGEKAPIYDEPYPFVSVIVPTYNRREFLPYLLYIYQYQDYPADRRELVILDDSAESNQGLIDQLLGSQSAENVRYLYSETRLALGQKRNQLNALARGEYIVCMDDDDYYAPDKISYTIAQMRESRALFSGCDQIYIWYSHLDKIYKTASIGDNHALNGTFAYHRNYLKRNRYVDGRMLAEEKEFLANFTNPVQQLAPEKAILCISHDANTFDKDFIMATTEATSMTLEDWVQDENLLSHYRQISHAPLTQSVQWQTFEKVIVLCENAQSIHWETLKQTLTDFGIDAAQLEQLIWPAAPQRDIAETQAHIAALERARQNGWKNVLLLSDDVRFVKQEKTLTLVNRFLDALGQIPWQVALLGTEHRHITELAALPGMVKLNYGHAACAYAVNHSYYSQLLAHYRLGLDALLAQESQDATIRAPLRLDQHWNSLMQNANWLALYPSFAYQPTQWNEAQQQRVESTHRFFNKQKTSTHPLGNS